MIKTLLLRHAETEYNAHQKHIGGRSNPISLSTFWQKQAHENTLFCQKESYFSSQVFDSTAVRVQQTLSTNTDTKTLSEREITFHDELNEVYQDNLKGQNKDQLLAPEHFTKIINIAPHWKAPNGKSHHRAEVHMMTFTQHNILDKYTEANCKT